MSRKSQKLAEFFQEVWRRRVFQVAVPYLVGGWLLIEVSDVVLGAFDAPSWILQTILIVFLAALPVVVVLAWIFDFTPTGLIRTSDSPVDKESRIESKPEPEPEQIPALALSLGDAQRRQITMLSCAFDIQGLNEDDPEFFRDSANHLEKIFSDTAERYQAHRMPGSADALTLVFGYPAAHDHDARRSVAAGLALLEAASRLDENHDGLPDLSVRIGIYTGLVVIDEPKEEGRDISIIGQVPRMADWLQSLAPAGNVVIGPRTKELASRFHASELLGHFKHEQTGNELDVYCVNTEDPPLKDKENLVQIGRDQELGGLLTRWDDAVDGEGQFVLVRGEPGIGKSSLIQAFQQTVTEKDKPWVLEADCSPYEQNTAMLPLVHAIRGSVLGFESNESNEHQLEKLKIFVAQHAKDDANALELLANLLSVPLPEDHQTLSDSPQQARDSTLHLLLEIIRREAKHRPVLLILEDLLWADPTTLEWIRMVVDEGPSKGVFLLMTARPAFEADWTDRSYVTVMNLTPLSGRSARTLIQQTAGEDSFPDELVEHIISETGGNPLYVHELTCAVMESDAWKDRSNNQDNRAFSLRKMKIPATLLDSLAARVDHLGAAKALLQLCSVLGREFDYDQLRAVSGTQNETALNEELESLVKAELLFRRGKPNNPSYLFKHILIQETAYSSLLKSTRKELHLRTAQIMEKEYPSIGKQRPAFLAWHYGEAGDTAKSVALWTQASHQSLMAYANFEAIEQTHNGLDMLNSMPQTADRIAQEVSLQSILGMALLASRGYAAPEVQQVFTRAHELCEELGDVPELFRVVVGLWMFYHISADLDQAKELSQTLIRIADTTKNPAQMLQSRYCLGYTLFYLGEYEAARHHLEDAMQGEVADFDYAAQSASGDDTRSHVRIVLSHLCWHLGEPVLAVQYMDEAIEIAEKHGHPYGIAFATFSASWLHVVRRHTSLALKWAKPADELAEQKGFRFFQPLSRFMLSWAQGRESQSRPLPGSDSVVEQLQECIADARANGSSAGHSFLFFVMAQDMIDLGRHEEAQQVLEQIWKDISKTGEGFFAPEYFRLMGQLSQKIDQGDEQAIGYFHEALECARKNESIALELRAANDLSMALINQDKFDEAHRLLHGIYQRFSERDNSVDFQRAEKILKKLENHKET